jgi:hypothetical protein
MSDCASRFMWHGNFFFSSLVLKKRPWNVGMENEVLWTYLRGCIRDTVWSSELMYLLKGLL